MKFLNGIEKPVLDLFSKAGWNKFPRFSTLSFPSSSTESQLFFPESIRGMFQGSINSFQVLGISRNLRCHPLFLVSPCCSFSLQEEFFVFPERHIRVKAFRNFSTKKREQANGKTGERMTPTGSIAENRKTAYLMGRESQPILLEQPIAEAGKKAFIMGRGSSNP